MEAPETTRTRRRDDSRLGLIAADDTEALRPVLNGRDLFRVFVRDHQLADLQLESDVGRQRLPISIASKKGVKTAINGQEVHVSARRRVELLKRDRAWLSLQFQIDA